MKRSFTTALIIAFFSLNQAFAMSARSEESCEATTSTGKKIKISRSLIDLESGNAILSIDDNHKGATYLNMPDIGQKLKHTKADNEDVLGILLLSETAKTETLLDDGCYEGSTIRFQRNIEIAWTKYEGQRLTGLKKGEKLNLKCSYEWIAPKMECNDMDEQ
jgi:hypothetical protein